MGLVVKLFSLYFLLQLTLTGEWVRENRFWSSEPYYNRYPKSSALSSESGLRIPDFDCKAEPPIRKPYNGIE
jgi:hypothetical protein